MLNQVRFNRVPEKIGGFGAKSGSIGFREDFGEGSRRFWHRINSNLMGFRKKLRKRLCKLCSIPKKVTEKNVVNLGTKSSKVQKFFKKIKIFKNFKNFKKF